MPAFTPFAQSDVVLDTQVVGTSTWTNNTNNLKSMHTASSNAGTGFLSTPTSSGAFHLDVYNILSDDNYQVLLNHNLGVIFLHHQLFYL